MKFQKSVLLSKTFWFNLMMALAPLLPGAAEYISGNTQVVAIGWSIVNMILRKVSKTEIKLLA